MADKYLSAYYNGNNGNKIYLELHVYTVATSIANNTTTERADLYAVVNDASYGWWNNYGSEAFVGIEGNNTTKTVNFDYRSTGVKNLISTWDTVIKHNDNGKATIGISAHHYSGIGLGNASVSGTMELDTIPRYGTSNQSLNSKTETTIKMNWSSDNTVDYLWYSTNNGSSWTGVDVTDGKSGTYTISGLSANTTYNIKTRVRRKDSQLTTDSGSLAVKTYSYPTQSLNNKTETTITINWSADSTIDAIYYSTNNGSNWSNAISVNATSGAYTISGLSSYTAYNIKTRVRRKSTQTLSNTSSLNVTTYQYPYVTAIRTNNLVIGNSQTLTLYNPLGRNVNVYMYQHTTGVELHSDSTNSTSITFTPNSDKLYKSIVSSQKGDCYYYCEYSGQIKNYVNGNYSINVNANIPTISNGGWGYYDSNQLSRNLTGNNKMLVNNLSNVFVSVSGDAISIKNSATLSSIKATIGDKSVSLNYNRTTNEYTGTIYSINSSAIFVVIVDSRGIQNTYSIDVNNSGLWKNFSKPIFNQVDTSRENGIGTTGLLNLKVNFWNANFGAIANEITKFSYRYKKTTDTSYSSFIDITDRMTKNDNGYYINASNAFLPKTDKGTIATVFEVGYEYNLQFACVDKSEIVVYSDVIILNSGIPCTAKQKNSDGTYSIGINKLPDGKSALDVKGAINIDQLRINGEATINKDENGSIYLCATNSQKLPPLVFRPNGINSGTGQAYFDVNGNLIISGTFISHNGKSIMGYSGNVTESNPFGNALHPGIYSVQSGIGISDAPYSGAIYGILKVYTNGMTAWNKNNNWIWHEFVNTDNERYYRHAINNSNWSAWLKLKGPAFKDIKTLSNVDAAGWTDLKDAQNYLIDKAFISYWNGAYTNTNSNLKYCVDGTIQAKPTTLYNNTTGSNGTVTLSQSAANFTYLEIFCRKNNSAYYVTQKVYSPNGKKASFVGSWSVNENGDPLLQFNTKIVQISGTTISNVSGGTGNLNDSDSNWVDNTANDLYIVRVVGCK